MKTNEPINVVVVLRKKGEQLTPIIGEEGKVKCFNPNGFTITRGEQLFFPHNNLTNRAYPNIYRAYNKYGNASDNYFNEWQTVVADAKIIGGADYTKQDLFLTTDFNNIRISSVEAISRCKYLK